MYHPKIDEVLRRDPRYPIEAYEFVYSALAHTQELLRQSGKTDFREDTHLTGQQLLMGIRDLALREFGLMARTVFRLWNINRTDDFGEIVYNLIEAELMSKNDSDSKDDFHAVYDLDEALRRNFRIELPCEAMDDA